MTNCPPISQADELLLAVQKMALVEDKSKVKSELTHKSTNNKLRSLKKKDKASSLCSISSCVQPPNVLSTPLMIGSVSLHGVSDTDSSNPTDRFTPTSTNGFRHPLPSEFFGDDRQDVILLTADDARGPGFSQVKNQDKFNYPLILLSQAGCLSVCLTPDVIIEIAVDHNIRVARNGKYSIFMNGHGTSCSLVHPYASILYNNKNVYGRFPSKLDKLVIIGAAGVLCSMEHLREAYLVSSVKKGASVVSLDQHNFPKMETDYTLFQFYLDSQVGSANMAQCMDIVETAVYERKQNGSLIVQINGIVIRLEPNGDVCVQSHPRKITCTEDGQIHVRTNLIDMEVHPTETACIKYGTKRVHVSCSGMVVSDGSSCTTMDRCGRILNVN